MAASGKVRSRPQRASQLELDSEDTWSALDRESLGQDFVDEQARVAHFREDLGKRLAQPSPLESAGAPRGRESDILDLSDPPAYVACPNPYVSDWIAAVAQPPAYTDRYQDKPYRGLYEIDKRHPVYSFHPYHTKVPPEIIRRLIEHYTQPGDLVLDGFCGSGMTGVAARDAGRNAVLVDLSPAATFVAGCNVIPHPARLSLGVLEEVLEASEKEWGHLFETIEDDNVAPVNYFVWSDVFTCPNCDFEFPFFPDGVVHHGTKVETRKSFACRACSAELNVRRVRRVIENGRKKKQLVWVNAGRGRERINRPPNADDQWLASDCEEREVADWYPTDPINPNGYSAKLAQLGDKAVRDVSRFLSRRNLIIFADLWRRASELPSPSMRHLCRATLTSVFTVISERQGYFGGGGGMSGNLYMPIVRMEKNIFDVLRRKLGRVEEAELAKRKAHGAAIVSTQSSTNLSAVPNESVDYVYVDPPFGANIIYSEVNAVMEAWLRVKTNDEPEAVIDVTRGRELDEYATLMRCCFAEFFRVLKPGRWMTVEFHNTMAEVWEAIQTEMAAAGFVVEEVGILDKGTTTILSDIRPNAAKHDLIISARKPAMARTPEPRSREEDPEAWTWSFVSDRLQHLPLSKERSAEMLFDRVVAARVRDGRSVTMSTTEFYGGLRKRFREWNALFFLPGQDPEAMADRAMPRKLFVDEPEQPTLFEAE